MPYKRQQEFMEELASEFGIEKSTFRCYTLESNPQIKVILFGKNQWDTCHIGFVINKHFHVLGLGSFTCINEDAKALYVALKNNFPDEEQKLKVQEFSLFDKEEQENIKNKFEQIFQKDENN